MKMNNVTFITKDGFSKYWSDFYKRYSTIKGVKDNEKVSKVNVIKLIALLKSEGFEIGQVNKQEICGKGLNTVHYCKLFQSHKKRCNYEIVVKISKWDGNDSYEVRISKANTFPRSRNMLMPTEITLYMHCFLNN